MRRCIEWEGNKLYLTEEAYCREGFYRFGDSAYGLTKWYEASAEDEEGETYSVIWQLNTGYDADVHDEDEACDWDKPRDVNKSEG